MIQKSPTSSLLICPSESNNDSGSFPSVHSESIRWNKSLIFNLHRETSEVALISSFSGFSFSRLQNYENEQCSIRHKLSSRKWPSRIQWTDTHTWEEEEDEQPRQGETRFSWNFPFQVYHTTAHKKIFWTNGTAHVKKEIRKLVVGVTIKVDTQE